MQGSDYDDWNEFTKAQADMSRFTHTSTSPWVVVLANDQRRARLEAIRLVLGSFEYESKDPEALRFIEDILKP